MLFLGIYSRLFSKKFIYSHKNNILSFIKKNKKEEKMRKKAQFAMEYLLVVAFSIVLTIPLIWYLYVGYEGVRQDVHVEQLAEVARELAFQSEKVYYQGPGSRSVLIASFPQGVTEAKVVRGGLSNAGTIEITLEGHGTINYGVYVPLCEKSDDYYDLETFSGPRNIRIIANVSTGCIYYNVD